MTGPPPTALGSGRNLPPVEEGGCPASGVNGSYWGATRIFTTTTLLAAGGGNAPLAQIPTCEPPLISIFGGMEPPALTSRPPGHLGESRHIRVPDLLDNSSLLDPWSARGTPREIPACLRLARLYANYE
jgi:hypothetical protein